MQIVVNVGIFLLNLKIIGEQLSIFDDLRSKYPNIEDCECIYPKTLKT